jgi:hypothetical protein
LYLQAAETFLGNDAVDAAADALSRVELARLNERETARYLLAEARVALARDRPDQARAALLALDQDLLSDPAQAALATADLLIAEGRPEAAAARLIDYARVEPGEPRQHLNDTIWHYLGQVPPFRALAMEAETTGPERGWWQLKSQMLRSFTLSEQRRRLSAWRESHPSHPAAVALPSALAVLEAPPRPLARVSLMLPLSGPLSRAGRSVRDAFIATYLSHHDEVSFEITIYDTAAEPMGTLYERALVEGAEVLIGPLDKESVAQLNQLNPEIPVLALNYLGDEAPAANLLQLGLAIEDEAATLEQWLTDARAERVLAFHNAEEWSQRAMRSLTASWRKPITVQMIEDIRTVTESVGVAMHVAASHERHDELESLLGEKLEFIARARGDVDAIVALVSPLEASALVPALRFHFADQVPVYATSQTVRGATPGRLRELNGFRVSELPWFTLDEQSYQSLNEAFDLAGSPFAALYALGVDAFRLADRAPLILDGHFTELLGSTGELEFAPSGRIQRRLGRAIIRNGSVVAPTRALGR